MNTVQRHILCAAGLSVFGGAALANCDSIVSVDYALAISTNNAALAAEILSSSPECFGGGSTTSRVQISGTMFQQAAAISSALVGRQLLDGPAPVAAAGLRGASAGAKAGQWNVWGNLGETDTRQRYAVNNAYSGPGFSKNSMDLLNTVFGVDYTFSPTLAVGASLGIDRGDGRGGHTNPAFAVNQIDSRGYAVAPYLGWQINRTLSLDASVGYGRGEIDTFTTNSVNSDRWFGAANLNYNRWMGNWQFGGRASFLHGVEDYGNVKVNGASVAGTDARNTLDQIRLAVQAGYWMNGVMPYAGLAYVNDVRRKTTQFGAPSNPIGRDAWEWRVGVNFYSLRDGITGGLAWSQEEGRNHQKSHNLTLNIGLRF
jgi:hypothetical protein